MTMKIFFTAALIFFTTVPDCLCQELFYTREGRVSFFSEAPLENIEAHNNRGSSVLDAKTGAIEFSVLIKGFMFEKSLMQEHFNENFMESDKYPRAVFKGLILDFEKMDLSKNGTFPIVIQGEMEIREMVEEVIAEGKLIVADGKIRGEALFELTVADFGIQIPGVVRENIARVVEVRVEANFKPLER